MYMYMYMHNIHVSPATLSGHSGAVRGLAFSPDGCLLASGSDDMMVRVWDAGSYQCIATLEKHSGRYCTCTHHIE